MKVDIGCGKYPKEGYLGVDMYYSGPEVRFPHTPMWELPFADNSVEAIYSSHALEHIDKKLVKETLREWYRVLNENGYLELIVPDLRWCVKMWLDHLTDDWWIDIIFGNQEHAGEFHKTGFTPEILEKHVIESGFTIMETRIIRDHDQDSIRILAKKEKK